MNLGWLRSILYGLVSGITEFLPISGQAHRILLLQFFGYGEETGLLALMVHLGLMAALLLCMGERLRGILRERAILQMPMRRRHRMPDPQKLLEWKLLCRVIPWVLIGNLFSLRKDVVSGGLGMLALQILFHAVILFIPTRMAQGNKDCRNMTSLDCISVGIGGGISVLPGISSMGAMTSFAAASGIARTYAVDFCLMIMVPLTALRSLLDVAGIVSGGMQISGFSGVLQCLTVALTAFGGGFLGIQILRRWAEKSDFLNFAYYSVGLALFTFIVYIIV